MELSRRRALGLTAAGALAIFTQACDGNGGLSFSLDDDEGGHDSGRLSARPQRQGSPRFEKGLQPLGVGGPSNGYIYVPDGYRAEQPAPLAVTLHGAGGDASKGIGLLRDFADEAGIILVAPKSRDRTWDVILGGFGPDVAFIDRVLEKVFATYAVDERKLAIQGFSDGASYALSLGLTNGDLFRHIMAFSPGFSAEGEPRGKPRIFVAHGIHDTVLPIDQTSRQIVPRLEDDGYDVTFVEFNGGHERRPEIAGRAVAWWLDA